MTEKVTEKGKLQILNQKQQILNSASLLEKQEVKNTSEVSEKSSSDKIEKKDLIIIFTILIVILSLMRVWKIKRKQNKSSLLP